MTVATSSIPVERLVLLGLGLVVVFAIIVYILFLLYRECARLFKAWVRAYARHLELQEGEQYSQALPTTGGRAIQRKKKGRSHRRRGSIEDDSSSGSDSNSESN